MTTPPRKKTVPLTLRPLGAYEARLARVCEETGWEPTQFIHFCVSEVLDLIDAEELTVPHVVRRARAARSEMAQRPPAFSDDGTKKNTAGGVTVLGSRADVVQHFDPPAARAAEDPSKPKRRAS